MNGTRYAIIMAIAATGSFARAQQTTKLVNALGARDSIPTLILGREEQRRAAHLRGDADLLASILSDDFLDIAGNGMRRTKQQNVEETRAHVIVWTSLVARNEQVRVFSPTLAIVTGEQEGAGTYNGQPFARHNRYMRVYLKRDARWQNIAAQSTPIAP